MWLCVCSKLVIIIGWVFFAFDVYKASKVELDFKEFDPYAELGIDRVIIDWLIDWFTL